jgi:hypothetical protein
MKFYEVRPFSVHLTPERVESAGETLTIERGSSR